jgi:mono/diheme cytochrome c family protein
VAIKYAAARCGKFGMTGKETIIKKRRHSRFSLVLVWVILIPSTGYLIGRLPVQKSDAGLGRIQFEMHCAACHQPDGSGKEGGGPPLAGSSWVSGAESRLIRIVLHGLRGPIEVGGETYNREMLGFGSVVTDEQIAAILTYVRSEWGGIDTPVGEESVSQIRRATADRIGYWTVDELLQIP